MWKIKSYRHIYIRYLHTVRTRRGPGGGRSHSQQGLTDSSGGQSQYSMCAWRPTTVAHSGILLSCARSLVRKEVITGDLSVLGICSRRILFLLWLLSELVRRRSFLSAKQSNKCKKRRKEKGCWGSSGHSTWATSSVLPHVNKNNYVNESN